MSSKERSNPINGTQKSILTEWMKDHPELVSGKFTNQFTKKDARKLWETVTTTLNAVAGGGNKEWMQWRKSWQDLKKNTKAKNSQIQKHYRGTGGGPPSQIKWSDADTEILALQNPTSLTGNDNIKESTYIFDFEPQPDNKVSSKYNEENYEIYCKENDAVNVVKVISNTLIEGPVPRQTQQLQKQVVPIKRPHCEEANTEKVITNNVMPCDGIESSATTTTPAIKKKKFTTKSSRLEKSLSLTSELVNNQHSQKQMQEWYYKTKIALLRREYRNRASYRKEKITCQKQANFQLRKMAVSLNAISKKFIAENPHKDS